MTYSTTEKTVMMQLLNNLSEPSFDNVHTIVVNDVLTDAMVRSLIAEHYITGAPENQEPDGTVTAWDLGLNLRGKVAIKMDSFDNQPLWSREHRSIDEAPLMEDTLHDKWYGDSTWEDNSYHNDTCPNFISFDLIKGKAVKIWSENKNPEKREIDEEPQYMVHLYETTQYMHEGKMHTEDTDFIEVLLATDSREEVFNFILHKEQDNEITRRNEEAVKNRIADLAMQGKRAPTIEDMIATRQFELNMYDAMLSVADAGIASDVDGEVGFTYCDRQFHMTVDQKSGKFLVTVSNFSNLFDTIGQAEIALWDEWACGEMDAIEIEMSEIDCLQAEYDNFLESTGLPSMSADELLVQTKGDSDSYLAIQWQRNYLSDFINRWEVAMDLDGTDGRTPAK